MKRRERGDQEEAACRHKIVKKEYDPCAGRQYASEYREKTSTSTGTISKQRKTILKCCLNNTAD